MFRFLVRVRHIDGAIQENLGTFDYEDLPERIKDAIDECPDDGEWVLPEVATGDRLRDLEDVETVVTAVDVEDE